MHNLYGQGMSEKSIRNYFQEQVRPFGE